MSINAMEETDKEEPCLTACPQTEEPTPKPRRNDPDIEPMEPALITWSKDDNMQTHTPAERGEVDDTQLEGSIKPNSDAPTTVTLPPDHDTRAEPNILDILDDE